MDAEHLFGKLEKVGRGSFGCVYKGYNKKTNEVIAIKEVDLEQDEEQFQHFQKELRLLSVCNNDRITRYYGSYLHLLEDGSPQMWIIMDYCGGGSVRQMLKPGPIAEQYIIVILREVMHAIAYLHDAKIIHRDIKAANILLSDSGKVKLCDFGVAGQLSLSTLRKNSFVGTPCWMAPEVITSSLHDFKADIWSFGITIYEIAVGEPPLSHVDPVNALYLIPRRPPPRLEGDYSKGLKKLVEQCLQMDPNDRLTVHDLLKKQIIVKMKKDTSVLQDLIVRYREWQAGHSDSSLEDLGDTISYKRNSRLEDDDDYDSWEFDGSDRETQENTGKIIQSPSSDSVVNLSNSGKLKKRRTKRQSKEGEDASGGAKVRRKKRPTDIKIDASVPNVESPSTGLSSADGLTPRQRSFSNATIESTTNSPRVHEGLKHHKKDKEKHSSATPTSAVPDSPPSASGMIASGKIGSGRAQRFKDSLMVGWTPEQQKELEALQQKTEKEKKKKKRSQLPQLETSNNGREYVEEGASTEDLHKKVKTPRHKISSADAFHGGGAGMIRQASSDSVQRTMQSSRQSSSEEINSPVQARLSRSNSKKLVESVSSSSIQNATSSELKRSETGEFLVAEKPSVPPSSGYSEDDIINPSTGGEVLLGVSLFRSRSVTDIPRNESLPVLGEAPQKKSITVNPVKILPNYRAPTIKEVDHSMKEILTLLDSFERSFDKLYFA